MDEVIKAVKKIDEKIEVTFEDDNSFYLSREDWNSEVYFDIEEDGINDLIIEKV